MTTEELIALRKSLGLTQAEMAEGMGLSHRAYQNVEAGPGIRKMHAVAATWVAMVVAVEKAEPMLAPAPARKIALSLANLITEGHA